ncbi:MAG: hypothetical protein MI700_06865 [Balneolales bacterium]|nr:hypothetical protein [Balneolales bacterium]
MSEEELLISIVAIVFGVGFAGFLFHNIFSLIRAAIEKRNSAASGDINPQFFKALGEFKRQTERRIANLESIVTELEEEKIRISDSEDSSGEIEIEPEEVRKPQKDENSNLRNMLNE